MVKGARTEIQKERNWALKKAQEPIKSAPESNGKKVEIIWKVTDSKSRQVKVDDQVTFVQSKDEAKGSFIVPYETLVLP